MKEIASDIFYVGVDDYETDLFESMWPLPEGVSYNSYVVKGENCTAVIDTVNDMFVEDFMQKIEKITSFDEIKYIILNHLEPDHSGSLLNLLEKAPDATILCSKRAVQMVEHLFKITKNVRSVEEGETVELGDHELTFYMDPLVHWPETMVTFDNKENVLFSGDAFGSFKALDGKIFDDENNPDNFEDETIRYFSNIVQKYTRYVLKALDKLEVLPIEIIAPSHGLIWRKNPARIVKLYRELSEMKGENSIVIIWASMYGNTKQVVDYVVQGVKEEGVSVKVLDFSRDHLSYQLKETSQNKGLILGFPTYDGEEFLLTQFYLHAIQRKRIKNRIVGFFGSSLWSGRALEKAEAKLSSLDWKIIKPLLEFKGAPTQELKKQAKELGKTVAREIKRH